MNVIKKNSHINLKILIDHNSGIYKAINTGIKFSSGDIISILGSGDFTTIMTYLLKLNNIFLSENFDIVYGDAIFFSKII